ncbi:MAG TPA: ATP synthase subunit I [Candidatus Acidoferrum sp.]|nr:ATP synthase subunit I [Candidatus Acidoferrum sp.]
MAAEADAYYAAAERRIEILTPVIGAVGALVAAFVWGHRHGEAVAAGAVISWLNFRWMKQGVNALGSLATPQEGAEKIRVPKTTYIKFMGRYALLVLGAYVILHYFGLPALSLLAGFLAVAVAVLAEMIGLLFRSVPEPRAGS